MKPAYYIPIRISGLSDGEHIITSRVNPRELELPEEFDSEIVVNVKLEKTHAHVILQFTVSAVGTFPCDRCLAPVAVPIDSGETLFYAFSTQSARLLDEDDVRVINPSEPTIELAPDVRDCIFLNVPMRRVCGVDADGNPLCDPEIISLLDSGDEEPIDARWERLQEFREKESLQ